MLDFINIALRAGVVIIVVIKLVRFYDYYRPNERTGLGVLGGCCFMTIPAIFQGPSSPFYEWAGTLFALGVLVYFYGRLQRTAEHHRANKEHVAIRRKENQ